MLNGVILKNWCFYQTVHNSAPFLHLATLLYRYLIGKTISDIQKLPASNIHQTAVKLKDLLTTDFAIDLTALG